MSDIKLYEKLQKRAQTSAFWRYCLQEVDFMIEKEFLYERGETQEGIDLPIYSINLPYYIFTLISEWKRGDSLDHISQIFFNSFLIGVTPHYLVISTAIRILKLPFEIGRLIKLKLKIKEEKKKKRLEEEEKRIFEDSNRKREIYLMTNQRISFYNDSQRRNILQKFASSNPEKSADEVFELFEFYTSPKTLHSDA